VEDFLPRSYHQLLMAAVDSPNYYTTPVDEDEKIMSTACCYVSIVVVVVFVYHLVDDHK